MINFKKLTTFLITLAITIVIGTAQSVTTSTSRTDKKYESDYKSLSAKVDKEHIRRGVYYLAQDPLPRRVLNWSLPGHTLSSLEEADAWIMQQLKNSGYKTETDETKVRAFGRDFSKKPLSSQYARPSEDAPWYTAHNIIADKQGTDYPEELIVILAHKDSQSWIASPGANDNAIGTCGVLELARVLSSYQPKHTLRFIFCNEEHTPWTSVTAAEAIKASGLKVLAVINLDGIGVKSPQQAGHLTNVTRYTTVEGERLADLMTSLNKRLDIGLEQTKYRNEHPDDDDGSFIKAGFLWAVLNIGSMPYGDPNYHSEGDTAEKVDFENAKRVVQLTLAAILHLDAYGRP
jgi:Zn-dependent M28 family amino/carboxypeptidase